MVPEVQNSVLVDEARNVSRHVEVEDTPLKSELDPEALGLDVVVATSFEVFVRAIANGEALDGLGAPDVIGG